MARLHRVITVAALAGIGALAGYEVFPALPERAIAAGLFAGIVATLVTLVTQDHDFE